ncbi:UDP-N-acetylglucosamine 2-epimerase [Candidatus Uhrbacteria bacterium RIFCSPHIGHO2_12_FULL_60_25]|uniref:UDP-N-acetylglucosamine 2-epimerase n=1 Tax=Candidatus Uhrbacteria bacterium RIFCSPHIGHO2_12_FULL_60_25 TaxID=1802399 RepID=A0A1F7UKG6_9BACT|nr:MAG: UDP-N-acetylglucosamine 2-epimerase [Candidatus Uhrbacteria bacterium RIFCSPHIGHO2_02_FULL_60_44]OGL78786.1 MAG: UDP-N-acetylglucosamine 2-epimerase [Candidatus Uhrbacteria bacterium RIFCSPHIGHO2_12_FULL_60_25]
MKHIVLLVGARPNFIKVAPLHRALAARGVSTILVHTGQHYDAAMSDVFFKELGIPAPDVHLGVGAGDRMTQTKKIMDALVPVLRERMPDALLVFGDVTSTAAGAMAGTVAGIRVGHVEAGLRSFNWRMPEELNRMIADHHSDWLFVTEPAGMTNLKNESITHDRVHLVGNVMIDSLRAMEPAVAGSRILTDLGLMPGSYGTLTLHRPENVDDVDTLRPLWDAISAASVRLPLVFPMHHRARAKFDAFGLSIPPTIRAIEPVGYIDMLALLKGSKVVLTDSGGLQEETAAFNVPCITLREQTERPVTVELGTSEVVGRDRSKILDAVSSVMDGRWKKGGLHPLWDGHAAERIADILKNA